VYSRCTHLGCTISWEADKNHFFCPCHASSFDTYGDVQNPPAPRALDLLAIIIEDGQVLVDTGSITQRDRFTTDQLTYA
jgi:cytochrome b6-f complex iron-sulfur subunit